MAFSASVAGVPEERPGLEPRRLLGLVYEDGFEADRMLSALGYALREQGVAVRGLVQRNTPVSDRIKCDMDLEELGSGKVFHISKDRGALARGCRLDVEMLLIAGEVLEDVLEHGCGLLIVNKFGRTEAEGGGLRNLLARSASHEITTIVGVPRRNVDAWLEFSGGLSDLCDVEDVACLTAWVRQRTGVSYDFNASKGVS
ncbi:MAG TPA: DUF2478 domain-containing protein [Xanthobacteraceae bacterium]|nr:DUF2478 domain-containing protein [Xanthobacteraceae bacterium]